MQIMNEKIITVNRKARHDYEVLDTFEAGLVLVGTEVKSLRDGKANLKDSYARINNGEMWLHGTHISVYSHGTYNNHDPERQRKLLLHKKELRKLMGRVEEAGLTLVPLKMYFKRGKAKVQIALARGKRQYDKRQDIAKRDAQREIARKMKRH
ncbi:MAG: SsrA-binding protein SmpB [Deferribacteres bacterium]|nr:SsrA-binding protein SmpB [candidate division KSB1 bacterium]MCB9501666.1 SsrA-binding protein SmpB [Deferribacteres bacterium]